MIRVKAVKLFNDGWEKRLRKPGEIFETTQERYEYWGSASLVIPVEEKKEVKNKELDLENMTKAELLEYADAKGIEGLNNRMTKAEIIAALEG